MFRADRVDRNDSVGRSLPIDGNVEVELAFSGPDLSEVDVEIANRISLELFLRRLAAFDLRQSADAVALKTAMQG